LLSTTEKRNELNRRTNRGAIHEVGIFIGLLLTADKVDKVDKVVDIWSRSLDKKLFFASPRPFFFTSLLSDLGMGWRHIT
jgi:hypothetical protein